MAIFFRGKLPKGGISTVNFKLPGTTTALEPKVSIAWMDDSGRAGLRFTDVSKAVREQLDQWLTAQCENMAKKPN
jgi:basic membrane lipoprotein Med (substrate-binding protein (PBP1-ABC) superfamily)